MGKFKFRTGPKSGYKFKGRECFVNTTDDFYPNYEGNKVKVRLVCLDPQGKMYRVNVWGNDDFGMEKDFARVDLGDAKDLYVKLSNMTNITKAQLKELGFVQF